MPIYEYNAAGTGYEVGKMWDYNTAGTGYEAGYLYEYTAAGVGSLIWQSRLEVFNPGSGWAIVGGAGTATSAQVTLNPSGVNQWAWSRSGSAMNYSGYANLYFNISFTPSSQGGAAYIGLGTSATSAPAALLTLTSYTSGLRSIPLAAHQGARYVWFWMWSDNGNPTGTITTVYAE